MDYARIGVPHFDGENYELWSRRMKTYIQAQGLYVWQFVVYGYKAHATPLTNRDGKKIEENDSRDRNSIENGVT
jgi:hypothetical protein